jgi:small subunit ribosomal protein S7
MLQHQFLLKRGWRRKVNFFQPPKKVYFSFDEKFSSNGRLSRKLYTRLSPPKKWSLNPLNPSCAGENLIAKSSHQIPSGKAPSYISKFVNHLMVGGKKGVAIHLFVAALHLFFKRLEEEERLDGLEKKGFAIKSAAFCALNEGFLIDGRVQPSNHLKSLILPVSSLKPFTFLQRPGRNLLGLPFSPRDGLCSASAEHRWPAKPPFTFLTDNRLSFVSSCKHPSLLSCLEFAVKNVEPSLEVRKKKIAGITRQIPCIVPKPRGQGLAIRWLISAAQEKRRKEGQPFYKSLAEELVNAYYKRGEPRQKRDSLHKVAESNRSFLRYRWW